MYVRAIACHFKYNIFEIQLYENIIFIILRKDSFKKGIIFDAEIFVSKCHSSQNFRVRLDILMRVTPKAGINYPKKLNDLYHGPNFTKLI